MPELQEVEEDQRSPGLFQVGAGVSHQELSCSPSTNWLAELANIATSPQSPLLKDAPHKRFVRMITSIYYDFIRHWCFILLLPYCLVISYLFCFLLHFGVEKSNFDPLYVFNRYGWNEK